MKKNLGSELLIYLLFRTGLRLSLAASMLEMSQMSIQNWMSSASMVQFVPKTFIKGMFIQPEGFLRSRFKSLAGHAFFQVFTKVKEHVQSCYQFENEKLLTVFTFVIAQELFQKEYVAHLKKFASDGHFDKQITASHLWQFVRFREAGLIRVMSCRCGHPGPESLSKSGSAHCSCRLPARNRKYWMDFGNEIDRILTDTDKGTIANRSQVDAVLQNLLLEASLSVLGIVEQPA